MTYVLDGIKTAMVEEPCDDGFIPGKWIDCPCGFRVIRTDHLDRPALRFHHDNCVQARIPECDHKAGFTGGRCRDCGLRLHGGRPLPDIDREPSDG